MNPFPFLTFLLVAITVAIGQLVWDHITTPQKWGKVILVILAILIWHAI